VTVNLKEGQPSIEEAMSTLDQELAGARVQGIRILKLIHGYGASGVGGGIKDSVHKRLNSLLQKRRIQAFTPAEEYSEMSNKDKSRMESLPQLKSSLKTDRQNPGVTYVEL